MCSLSYPAFCNWWFFPCSIRYKQINRCVRKYLDIKYQEFSLQNLRIYGTNKATVLYNRKRPSQHIKNPVFVLITSKAQHVPYTWFTQAGRCVMCVRANRYWFVDVQVQWVECNFFVYWLEAASLSMQFLHAKCKNKQSLHWLLMPAACRVK